MIRILLLIVPFLASACTSYTDFISSSTEQKRAAYKSHRPAWKRTDSPSHFGRERSVQLLQGTKVVLTDKKLHAAGKLGMATLVTADGYALTAAHVVSGLSSIDTVLRMKDTHRAPVHAQWTNFTIRDRLGHLKSHSKSVQLFAYGSSVRLTGTNRVETATLRVIRIFPGRDFALVKLPVRSTRWFTGFDAQPSPGAVVFACGNGATPYEGPSAGEVAAVKRTRRTVRTIDTTIPLASGDSGGPVYDSSGNLVGIISHVRPSKILPVPKLDHSSLRMIDPAVLRDLIRRDRARPPASPPPRTR